MIICSGRELPGIAIARRGTSEEDEEDGPTRDRFLRSARSRHRRRWYDDDDDDDDVGGGRRSAIPTPAPRPMPPPGRKMEAEVVVARDAIARTTRRSRRDGKAPDRIIMINPIISIAAVVRVLTHTDFRLTHTHS
jgi:hypothetical protein